MKKPKWLTFLNFIRLIFFLFSLSGFIFALLGFELGKFLLNQAWFLFGMTAFLEVSNLRAWVQEKQDDIAFKARITGRILYKLKLQGVKIRIDGKDI